MYSDKSSRVIIDQSGAVGTKVVLPLDDNLYVTSVNMKATAYTIAAPPKYPCKVTAKVTAVGTGDTLGSLYVTGTLADGTTCTEAVALVSGETVSTIGEFKTLTQLITPSWVIDVGAGNDTIVVGAGATGSGAILFSADDDRIVASASMKVGAYTIAAQPQYPTTLTVTATASGTADTAGTLTIKGLGEGGDPVSEVVTPIAGSTVTTANKYSVVLSAIGAGWVIDAGSGNDTIKVGVSAVSIPATHYISMLHVVSAAVVAAQTNVSGFTTADLTEYTSIPVGLYPCKLSDVSLTSGEAIAYLARL